MENDKLKICKKILQIRKDISSIEFDSSNAYESFNYASSPIILKAIRKVLNDNNVILLSSVKEAKTQFMTDNKTIFTEVFMEYTFVDADSGQGFTMPWYGQGLHKSGERGVGKAYTYAEKYFLLKFFNLPTHKKDDPDFKTVGDGANIKRQKPIDTDLSTPIEPKNKISEERPPEQKKLELTAREQVLKLFDDTEIVDVDSFAKESADKQGVELERLYESALKRQDDFIAAFKKWSENKK